MAELDVRIETLPPMRVASVRVTSANPEADGWKKLKEWAASKGLLDRIDEHPVFGHTFQPQQKDSPEHDYEWWMAVGPDTELGGDVVERLFDGGIFAVTTSLGPPMPETWKRLVDWVESSSHRWRKTEELEKPRNPPAPEEEWVFDLYLPIDRA